MFCFSTQLKAEVLRPKNIEDDKNKIAEARERCEVINTLLVNNAYKLSCHSNYNHYGPTKKTAQTSSLIKIANYNLLHPGTSKALFKNYKLVAKIINEYDIVAGLELLATVGHDEESNRAVLDLIRNSPAMVEKLRSQKSKIKNAKQIQEINFKIDKLVNDTRTAYDLYRAPGYLKVLNELKKIDSSWGLILSPRGDSALLGSVEELSGFFYRANTVTPAINPHCKEFADTDAGTPYACFINLTKKFMGKDLAQYFSRRPFMASFKVNNTTISLITSHVVFTYSGDEASQKNLMMDTFGVGSYTDLSSGINAATFARFAEIKNTLDFMNKFRKKYAENKIIYMGDTNLSSKNLFWTEVLKAFPGGELLINEPTTLSPARFSSTGKETNGVANDYDHFILDKNEFKNCNDGEVYNYYKENIYKDVEKLYVIRSEVVGFKNKAFGEEGAAPLTEENDHMVSDGDILPIDDPAPIKLDYPLTPAAQSKIDKYISKFELELTALKTVKRTSVVADDFQISERTVGLNRRIFLRQLTNPYYYRFMQEVLSDHLPVALTCKF